MAEATAEAQAPGTSDLERVKALAAASDNVGAFFGEDVFIAIGSVLLMKGALHGYGTDLPPLSLPVWAIPTAIAVTVIHGGHLLLADRRLKRRRAA